MPAPASYRSSHHKLNRLPDLAVILVATLVWESCVTSTVAPMLTERVSKVVAEPSRVMAVLLDTPSTKSPVAVLIVTLLPSRSTAFNTPDTDTEALAAAWAWAAARAASAESTWTCASVAAIAVATAVAVAWAWADAWA